MTRRTVVEREAERLDHRLGWGMRSEEMDEVMAAMRRVERATLARVRANLRAMLDRDQSWDDRDALACCRPERKR